MIDSAKALLTFEGDNWQDFLESVCLFEIFKYVIEKYQDQPGVVKSIVRYIVWAYSKNSEMVSIGLGADWLKTKKRIYEASYFPPTKEIHDSVFLLKDLTIASTIQAWLKFQDEEAFHELIMLQDLRSQMQASANGSILKSTGEIDYDQKFKNAKYSIELYEMIRDCEKKLIQNDPVMKESIKEVKAAVKVKETLGPELFSK